jgi:hypothetical protein
MLDNKSIIQLRMSAKGNIVRVKSSVSAVAIGLAVGAVLSGCSPNPLEPTGFSVLKSKATAEDKVPGLASISSGIRSKNTRFLGTSGADSYWIGVQDSGAACLIGEVEAGPVSSCTNSLMSGPVVVGMKLERRREVRLVRDDAQPADMKGWTKVGANLFVKSP